MDFIMQPWPWWFSGILIGLTVPLLYILTGQGFGISTSFPTNRRDVFTELETELHA